MISLVLQCIDYDKHSFAIDYDKHSCNAMHCNAYIMISIVLQCIYYDKHSFAMHIL